MATNKKRKNETAFKFFSPLLRLIFRIYYNPKIINKEVIPKEGPILLVCNHKHVFDQCFIIMATKRPIRYMAKKEYFDGKFAWFFRLAGCIPVDRSIHDDAAKAAALEVLELDGAVGLFPEGTRNAGEELSLLPFKEGAMKIATKTGCPIIPVSLNNTAAIFENQKPRIKKAHVILEYGSPIYPNTLEKEELKHLGAKCQEIIQETIQKNTELV